MSKLVRIQSTITITVTGGLNYKDTTNPDAHVPDRLKVSPEWPKCMVQIKQGVGDYPAEIVEWNTVKALAADKILTIGEIKDAQSEEELKQIEDFKLKEQSIKSNETKPKRTRKNLNELTED